MLYLINNISDLNISDLFKFDGNEKIKCQFE